VGCSYVFPRYARDACFNFAGSMTKEIPHQNKELEARDLQVHFSPAVQDAFRTIAVAARTSEHFDSGIYEIAKDWSSGKPTSVHDVMISLPVIAAEVMKHVAATRDQTMKEAWDDLSTQISEKNGFTVSQSLQRRR
jgi:hypothetical protein